MTKDDAHIYHWNHVNRLTKVELAADSSDAATYAYDALRRRIEKVDKTGKGDLTTRHVYGGMPGDASATANAIMGGLFGSVVPVVGTGVGLAIRVGVSVLGSWWVVAYDIKQRLHQALVTGRDRLLTASTNDGWTFGGNMAGEPIRQWRLQRTGVRAWQPV